MGGPQGLSLDSSCVKKQRAILHELGHSIGFFHEQNRPDRNENVNVFYDNIDYGIPHEEFEAFTSIYFENHGLPYDYNSIMHYNGDQSSSNGNPTIEAHDKDIPVGLSVVLTELDIIRTNLYYSCPGTTNFNAETSFTKTVNLITGLFDYNCHQGYKNIL